MMLVAGCLILGQVTGCSLLEKEDNTKLADANKVEYDETEDTSDETEVTSGENEDISNDYEEIKKNNTGSNFVVAE